MDQSSLWPVKNQATQQEVSLDIMHLNHPETISPAPQSMEKLSSTKLVPGAEKVGDCLKPLIITESETTSNFLTEKLSL